MLQEKTSAPNFTLPDHNGDKIDLTSLAGSWVVLWWYPKADTPGCTIEGQGFRDLSKDFEAAGASIFGISLDQPEANAAFVKNHDFPYRLLSDVDRKVSDAYHATKPPEAGEEPPAWSRRISYLIDPKGNIAKAYKVDDVTAHPQQVLSDLCELAGT